MRVRLLFLLVCLAAGSGQAQTISISPKSATVAVGSTKQLSRSSTAIWSSSDTSVATVSSAGLVTAKRPGTATISVSIGGLVARSVITVPGVVVPPPAPDPTPAPTAGSAEPSGMTLIDQRSFSSLQENASPHSPAWDTDNSLSIARDSTAPKSPPSVLRSTFPAGFAGGSSSGHAGFPIPGNYRVLYVSYWAKYSSNWQGHLTGVNKHVYAWANGMGVFYFEAAGVGSESLDPRAILQGTPHDATLTPNLSSVKIPRGQWFHVELVIVGNTSGAANGSVDWWIDGIHAGSRQGQQFTSAATSWDTFEWRPVWGGVGDTVKAAQTFDVDHVYLSGKK